VVLIIVTGSLLIASVVAPSVFEALQRWRHGRRMHKTLPQGPASGATSATAPGVQERK
jgi:rhamnose transport system permease protein